MACGISILSPELLCRARHERPCPVLWLLGVEWSWQFGPVTAKLAPPTFNRLTRRFPRRSSFVLENQPWFAFPFPALNSSRLATGKPGLGNCLTGFWPSQTDQNSHQKDCLQSEIPAGSAIVEGQGSHSCEGLKKQTKNQQPRVWVWTLSLF